MKISNFLIRRIWLAPVLTNSAKELEKHIESGIWRQLQHTHKSRIFSYWPLEGELGCIPGGYWGRSRLLNHSRLWMFVSVPFPSGSEKSSASWWKDSLEFVPLDLHTLEDDLTGGLIECFAPIVDWQWLELFLVVILQPLPMVEWTYVEDLQGWFYKETSEISRQQTRSSVHLQHSSRFNDSLYGTGLMLQS